PGRLWVYARASATLQSSIQAWDYGPEKVTEIDVVGGLSPDCRTLAIGSYKPHPIRDWVTARGMRWPFSYREHARTKSLGVAAERVIGQLPAWPDLAECR